MLAREAALIYGETVEVDYQRKENEMEAVEKILQTIGAWTVCALLCYGLYRLAVWCAFRRIAAFVAKHTKPPPGLRSGDLTWKEKEKGA